MANVVVSCKPVPVKLACTIYLPKSVYFNALYVYVSASTGYTFYICMCWDVQAFLLMQLHWAHLNYIQNVKPERGLWARMTSRGVGFEAVPGNSRLLTGYSTSVRLKVLSGTVLLCVRRILYNGHDVRICMTLHIIPVHILCSTNGISSLQESLTCHSTSIWILSFCCFFSRLCYYIYSFRAFAQLPHGMFALCYGKNRIGLSRSMTMSGSVALSAREWFSETDIRRERERKGAKLVRPPCKIVWLMEKKYRKKIDGIVVVFVEKMEHPTSQNSTYSGSVVAISLSIIQAASALLCNYMLWEYSIAKCLMYHVVHLLIKCNILV